MEARAHSPKNGQTTVDGGQASPSERIHRASRSAEQAWSYTREAIADLREVVDVKGSVDRHPYGTLLAALGVGYVLGGGLFTRLTARLVGLGIRMGIRMAVVPALEAEIVGLARAFSKGGQQEGDIPPGSADVTPQR